MLEEGLICSLCCGETRSAEKCDGCSFFKDMQSIRNYKKAHYYTPTQVSDDMDLQDQAVVIESAICRFDEEQDGDLTDGMVQRILESLLDRYHFKDTQIRFSDDLEECETTLCIRSSVLQPIRSQHPAAGSSLSGR